MDPLSLLCRLATSVPPPRFHTVKYSGVLAPASTWRARIAPPKPAGEAATPLTEAKASKRPSTYRPWAEFLMRTFGVDVLQCPKCKGRMKLIAMVTEPKSVARYLAGIGELTNVPGRSPSRGPPYWKSIVLRKKALAVRKTGSLPLCPPPRHASPRLDRRDRRALLPRRVAGVGSPFGAYFTYALAA